MHALDIIDLAGEPFVRGRQLGSSRRERIGACLADWLASLRLAGVPDPNSYLRQMLHETYFLDAVRDRAPELLDEVRGMAQGAQQPFELMFAAQLMDEEWAYRKEFLGTASAQKCSSVSLRGAQVTWLGQNMDLGGFSDGHQAVLRIAADEDGPCALIFTLTDMICLMGVNGSAFGVCVNAIPQLAAAREGLPVAFVTRKLLQCSSTAEAAQLIGALPHATAQHYLLADSVAIRSFEASSQGVLEYHASDRECVLHTNHPLAEARGVPCAADAQADSERRLASLKARLGHGAAGLGEIKAALSSTDDPQHPVCRSASAKGQADIASGLMPFTTGSMISALRTDNTVVDSWISCGPPCQREYVHVPLRS